MSKKVYFVYSSDFLKYDLGKSHPFSPLRIQLVTEMCWDMGILLPEDLLSPRMAGPEELLLVHSERYIKMVKQAGAAGKCLPGCERYNLGTEDNPVFSGMHEAASLIVGGTLVAADYIMQGKADHVLHIAGGLHHAMHDQASGFCIYNDAAVAIAYLKQKYGARVAYIDIDAHHGDGVQWAFYSDPEVLTISFHESGRYLFPGTGDIYERGIGRGYGYTVNVPLEPFTEDDSLIDCFYRVVPSFIDAFRPDIIISQNGCDGHALDPLSHLSVTTRAYKKLTQAIHQLAHDYAQGRWIALGGGGYDYWRVVPRVWTSLWGEVSGREVSPEVPYVWLDKFARQSPVELPLFMEDSPEDFPPKPRRAEISGINWQRVEKLMYGQHLLKPAAVPLTKTF
ncbi:acetoin utilization protein AcuC [Calderihabitans maritimus]|uniref:Acetoin utilization protein AcuC n=1 Tax=Calderihabitans maritimus TaxID=1246530 RepID=A0A1Z5HQJ2_9FIRM|nr:acetoin utilization protein AcuC [Calderihabitans maritimus]GAW91803.1 hypothetical protein KKC1_09630 [Calderihabitans maritimus]